MQPEKTWDNDNKPERAEKVLHLTMNHGFATARAVPYSGRPVLIALVNRGARVLTCAVLPYD
jgi:hypothetical protein